MQEATSGSVRGNFDGATFTAHGITSTFTNRDGKYFVRTDGPDGKTGDFEIAYTFGVDPLQQYLVRFPDGRLQPLSIAWDTRPASDGGERWFHLYPDETISAGDVLHWTSPAQSWNAMCADCHSTNVRKNYDLDANRYDTRWSEINVGCEACHGPGADHVTWAKNREDGESVPSTSNGITVPLSAGAAAAWVMQPKNGIAQRSVPLASRLEIETCAPCHSRRRLLSDRVEPGAAYMSAHRPALLEDGLYYADGQIDDEVFEYGSFLQSAMYRAGVTCSDCHDPHSLKLRADGNTLCGQCHQPEKFDVAAHHHHPEGSTGASCAACHMPMKTYMVVDDRRDHSFRVPRPDLSTAIGAPNTCNVCHTEKSARWAADTIRGWQTTVTAKPHFAMALHSGRTGMANAEPQLIELAADGDQPGIARATALSLLQQHASPRSVTAVVVAASDDDPLVRMGAAQAAEYFPPEVRATTLAPLLDDPILAVRLQAALSLADGPSALNARQRSRLDVALEEYRRAEMVNADRPDAHVNLGLLALRLGRTEEAESAYLTAIKVGPYFVPAYVNLADLYRALGQDDRGEVLLRQALEIDTENPDIRHALGLLLVRRGRKDAALEELRRAADHATRPAHRFTYGIALYDAGAAPRAIEVLIANLRAFPSHRDTLIALATIHRQAGDRAAAREYARKLVDIAPHDPTARELLRSLQ